MEAWWNDPPSDPGVARATEEEHELRVDKAGLLMEAAEAARPPRASNFRVIDEFVKPPSKLLIQ
jgi:hypothetical protein